MPLLRLVIAAVVVYLIGSIPVGYLVIRLTLGKIFAQSAAVGPAAPTRCARAVSWAGIATGIGDILKGFLAVVIARLIVGDAVADQAVADIVGGVAAVIGHNYSVFMGFRGGVGTTPNVGGAISIWPLSALWLLPLLPFGLNVIRYASLMSLMVAGGDPDLVCDPRGVGIWPLAGCALTAR